MCGHSLTLAPFLLQNCPTCKKEKKRNPPFWCPSLCPILYLIAKLKKKIVEARLEQAVRPQTDRSLQEFIFKWLMRESNTW
jgi:hypothetical protein